MGDRDESIEGKMDDCVTTEVNGVGLLDGSLVGKIVGSKVGAISE